MHQGASNGGHVRHPQPPARLHLRSSHTGGGRGGGCGLICENKSKHAPCWILFHLKWWGPTSILIYNNEPANVSRLYFYYFVYLKRHGGSRLRINVSFWIFGWANIHVTCFRHAVVIRKSHLHYVQNVEWFWRRWHNGNCADIRCHATVWI